MEEFIPSYEQKVGHDADRLLCRTLLADLLQTDSVFFTARGNKSIELALGIVRKKGYTELLIPDQGGWMTYEKYAKKASLHVFFIKTKRGKFDEKALQEFIESKQLSAKNCALLLSSMPAYAFTLETERIASFCKEQGIFFINDVAASIAEPDAHYGDIIIGSFGKAKPLPLESGGFIAGETNQFTSQDGEIGDVNIGDVNIGRVEVGGVDTGEVTTGDTPLELDLGDVDIGTVDLGDANIGDAHIGDINSGKLLIGTILLEKEPELEYTALARLLETLQERTKTIKEKAQALKTHMQQEGIEVMYPEDEGYNVIVPFTHETDKEKLIKIGQSFDERLEYTECPRYIRVEEKAISFEVKRYFTRDN